MKLKQTYRPSQLGLAIAALAAFWLLPAPAALADKIKNPTAIFAGLDKITGRIISFEVAIDETVQFGSLQITPRICYTRPPTEAPHTTSFVEVEEVLEDKKFKKIFSGWMFSASPGLHGVEHPVYDAWLTDCKGGTKIIKTAKPKDDDILDGDKLRGTRQRAEETKPKKRPRRTTRRRKPTREFYPQRAQPSRPAPPPRRSRREVNPFGNY